MNVPSHYIYHMPAKPVDQYTQMPEFQPLFSYWNDLSTDQQNQLLNQIESIDLTLLKVQESLLSEPIQASANFEPFTNFATVGQHSKDKKEGFQRIQAGQMACLVLAGGQGTRLRFDKPKGEYPISVIQQKSLFQLIAEKTRAASTQAGRPLDLAIMTSPQNDAETRAFFEQHQYFGLKPEQVYFFVQGMLPFLDEKGQLFLESPAQIALGPNGNGFCLKELMDSGVGQQWKAKGIQYVNVILVDNPLADPFDQELLGFHSRQGVDATLKCTEKKTPEEKVGVVVKKEGHCEVIEYSELSDDKKKTVDENGKLRYRCANLSLFCFSMSFIEQLTNQPLPLHRAWKAAKQMDASGKSFLPTSPNAWKFEAYIFDVLHYTNHVAALLYPRETCFAPLKNFSGADSIETVKQALQNRDCQILEELTGFPAPSVPFELAQDFYYPTPELQKLWQGKQVTTGGYIEAF